MYSHRRPKNKNKKNKRATPQAPPKPIIPPNKFKRSVSSVGSVYKKKLLPKNGAKLLQSSTSFEKGVNMIPYYEKSRSVDKYDGVNAYQSMIDLKHRNLPSLTEISNNIIKGK